MKRIFVVGFPRSGTTLVQSLLGGHPTVATFPETHFFEGIVPRWRPVRGSGFVRPDALRIRARLRDARVGWLPGLTDLARPTLGHWSGRFVDALDAAATATGADAWIEKTPGHYGFVPEIGAHVEGARFVHVVRPGLDAVASYHRAVTENPGAWGRRKFWFDLSPAGLARRWVDAVGTTLSRAGDEGHHVIRYDDVVRAPAETVRDTFARLGLDASDATVHGALRERPAVAAGVVLGSETWKAGNTQEIGKRAAGEWVEHVRAELAPELRAAIRALDARVARLPAGAGTARAFGANTGPENSRML